MVGARKFVSLDNKLADSRVRWWFSLDRCFGLLHRYCWYIPSPRPPNGRMWLEVRNRIFC